MRWRQWGLRLVAGATILAAFLPAGDAGGAGGDGTGDPHNGLAAQALLDNPITTNKKALQFLLDHALNEATFKDEYMALQLKAPGARAVMDELIACALEPSATVVHEDLTWRGDMGLCPSWGTAGNPSQRCKELVSACLFAKVNALYRRIPVSFGGPNLHLRGGPVATVKRLPKSDGTPALAPGTMIESFSQGWQSGYVGLCARGAPVALGIDGSPGCAPASLRACKGVFGCDGSTSDVHLHTGFIKETGDACASPLSFDCPGEGYFSVMTRSSGAPVTVRASGGGKYPGSEDQVFSFIEGAFFGNMLDPGGLTRSREYVMKNGQAEPVVTRFPGDTGDGTVAHPHMYACYTLAVQEESAQDDEIGVAYLNARVCATPDAKKKCFSEPPKRCHYRDAAANAGKGSHCKWDAAQRVFTDCEGDKGHSYAPITVRLYDPCSLVDHPALCDSIRHASPPPAQELPPRGCGGCSSDGGGRALAPVSTATFLALLLSARRRRAGASRRRRAAPRPPRPTP